MSSEQTFISVSEIARLAGVRRTSVVSNWRRRAPDFPRAVARGSRGDLFDRREVEEWLASREANKRPLAEDALDVESIGGLGPWDDVIEVALELLYLTVASSDLVAAAGAAQVDAAVGAALAATAADLANSGDSAIGDADALAHDPALSVRVWRWLRLALAEGKEDAADGGRARVGELCEALLDLRSRRRSRAADESRTARWVARLVVRLAGADHGRVFDPAAGEAGFLLEAGRAGGKARLIGWEYDPAVLRIAKQRMAVHGLEAELRQTDSFGDGGIDVIDADAVICDAPFGLRQDAGRWSPTDPRWRFGLPAPIADLGWLELAIHHLRPNGHAAVLLPAASLYRGGSEARIRTELLQAGLVEAIIALPPGTALHTDIPIALWLLRARAHSPRATSVLLIDATDEPTPAPTEPSRSLSAKNLDVRIVETVQAWRNGAELLTDPHVSAVAVPIDALIEADADVMPTRWVGASSTSGQIETRVVSAANDLASARAALTRQPLITPSITRGEHTARRRRIRELVASRQLETLPGARIPTTPNRDGTRVLGPWDFRSEPSRYAIAPADLPRTQAGDVVVMPSGGAFQTFVDTEGGHLLAAPLQALRITQYDSTELLDPHLLAASISRPGATRGTAGAAGRSSVRDIDVLLLEPDQARRLLASLDVLHDEEQLARDFAAAAAALRHALLDAANAGWDLTDSQPQWSTPRRAAESVELQGPPRLA